MSDTPTTTRELSVFIKKILKMLLAEAKQQEEGYRWAEIAVHIPGDSECILEYIESKISDCNISNHMWRCSVEYDGCNDYNLRVFEATSTDDFDWDSDECDEPL